MYRKWNRNYRSENGLSPETNRLIGSLSYFVVHSVIFYVSFKIWGINMFDEIWFYLMHFASFYIVRFSLLAIGVWVY